MTPVFFLLLFGTVFFAVTAFLKKEVLLQAVGVQALFFIVLIAAANMMRLSGRASVFEVSFFPFFSDGTQTYFWGLSFDAASAVLCAFVLAAGFVLSLFSYHYFPQNVGARFLCLIYLTCFSVMLCLGARNAFQFLVGWDACVLSAYFLLILFYNQDDIAKAGVRFWLYHKVSDIPLYLMFFMLYRQTDSFDLAMFYAASAGEGGVFFALLLSVVLIKSMCFDVAELAKKPLPALAFTAPVAFGALSVCVLYRFLPENAVFSGILLAVGSLTALSGVVFALFQTEIKRLVCGVLTSVFGFVFSGFSLVDKNTALLLFIAYVLPALFLILAVGAAVFCLNGGIKLDGLNGLRKKQPFLYAAVWLFCLSLTGAPYLGTYPVWKVLTVRLFEKHFGFETLVFAAWFGASFLTAFVLGHLIAEMNAAVPENEKNETRSLTVSMRVSLAFGMGLMAASGFASVRFDGTVFSETAALAGALLSCAGFPCGIIRRKRLTARVAARRGKAVRKAAAAFFKATAAAYYRVREAFFILRSRRFVPVCVTQAAETARAMHLSYYCYTLVFILTAVCLFVLFVPFLTAKG